MEEVTDQEARKRKASTCFAKETWIILGIALVCPAVNAYAIFYEPHSPSTAPGELHIKPVLSAGVVWTLEIALALLSLWLIRFAFSEVPRGNDRRLGAHSSLIPADAR